MRNPSDTFRELRKRAGYQSLAALAPDIGFAGASSLQRYERPDDFADKMMPLHFIHRLVPALVGKGFPPITEDEVYALAGAAAPRPLRLTTKAPDLTDARPLTEIAVDRDLPDVERMPKNVPVVGSSQGGDGFGWFQLNGQISDYVRRPPGIAHLRDVVATYVVGDSMRPWREQGELVYLHPTRPARTGDYVVLDLYGEDDEPGPALLKRLVAKTPTIYRLGQWNPLREDIEIEAVRVRKVWRVIDWSELLGV